MQIKIGWNDEKKNNLKNNYLKNNIIRGLQIILWFLSGIGFLVALSDNSFLFCYGIVYSII